MKTKITYTREQLIALRESNTKRPEDMAYIPGVTSAPLVKTVFQAPKVVAPEPEDAQIQDENEPYRPQ